MADIKNKLIKYKYPAAVLIIGLLLMLFPTGGKKTEDVSMTDAQVLCTALSETEGVGEVKVILSESGAVVVCEGANNAKVRLDIIRAVGAYTGLTADKISVLRMTQH